MATIQDIFDWLNQGAQGDIPGTGGGEPNQPQASQPQQAEQSTAPSVTPSAFQSGPQPTMQGLPTSPQDYMGDIPPTMLMHYQALVSGGLPPSVARSILTQPSVGEGESPSGSAWPQNYRGWWQDYSDASKNYGKVPLEQHMWDVRRTQQQNLPTWEQNTPGDDDNLGFQRLPTGQYVPYPSQGLDYWAAQGNPSSFYWNPQPGSSWLSDLLGGQ